MAAQRNATASAACQCPPTRRCPVLRPRAGVPAGAQPFGFSLAPTTGRIARYSATTLGVGTSPSRGEARHPGAASWALRRTVSLESAYFGWTARAFLRGPSRGNGLTTLQPIWSEQPVNSTTTCSRRSCSAYAKGRPRGVLLRHGLYCKRQQDPTPCWLFVAQSIVAPFVHRPMPFPSAGPTPPAQGFSNHCPAATHTAIVAANLELYG